MTPGGSHRIRTDAQPPQLLRQPRRAFHGQGGFLFSDVGYAMADHPRQSLVIQALEQALQTRRLPPGLICHSDRGGQYCAWDYQQRLHQHGFQPSMSRCGNCHDNAPIESFWGILKTELVHPRRFQTRQQAIDQITEYIKLFYNRQRLQTQLGYLSPAAFEQRFYQSQLGKT